MRNLWQASALAALSFGAAAPAVAADTSNPLVEHVRTANQRFEDSSAALAEGYTAISCTDGSDGVVSGVHYVNSAYLRDEVPAIGRPQALMYEPGDDGRLNLIAVEYITFKGPAWLEGQPYHFIASPNRYGLVPFYELLVWAGEPNPRGIFADGTPNVTCLQARAK
jgi:hypothetical protein